MAEQGARRNLVEPGKEAGWGLVAGVAAMALTLGVMVLLSSPSSPRPKDAPPTEFSAGRAREIMASLLGEEMPHPVGSAANARVRERILATLRGLGLVPKVEQSFICSRSGDCGRVSNVLARLEGREPGSAILLASHYDSLPAGPGASDDLTGVAAILEIVRVLKAGPPPRHTVLFLIDDGEEEGLLGAEAFATWSPAMAEVGAVVNLEARGTEGPSLMFETSSPDALPVAVYSERAPKPFASSLFPTVYRFLPNDTDLTVFKTRGLPGLNFAFIGAPNRYHTALDTLANSSPASLQHQGENALAAVRGLAEADLASAPHTDAVYFDLLHATVVRWPAGLSPILGLIALILNVAAAVLARRRGAASWGAVSLGMVAGLPALIITLLLGFGLQALLASAFPVPWVARPLPATVAFWLLALASTLWVSALLGRRSPLAGLGAGVWILWSLLGLILGLTLPGLSYLFLVPALVGGVCGLALGGSATGRALAVIVPAVVVGLLWFDLLRYLYLGLGFAVFPIIAVLLSLVLGTLVPLLPASGSAGRRWLPSAAAAGAVIAAVVAMVTPPFSPEFPRSLNLQFFENVGSGGRWVIRGGVPAPEPLRSAGHFPNRPQAPYPWSGNQSQAFVAQAPPLNAPGPELTVLSDSVSEGKRQLRLRLRSPRGAPIGILYVPEESRLESFKMEGQEILRSTGRSGTPSGFAWRSFSNFTLPPEGSVVEVVLGATQPLSWYVVDRSPGLPPFAAELLAARARAAVPIQEGDTTIVSRKVKI